MENKEPNPVAEKELIAARMRSALERIKAWMMAHGAHVVVLPLRVQAAHALEA